MIFMITIELCNKKTLDDGIQFPLPVSSLGLKNALQMLNVKDISECDVSDAFSDIDELDNVLGDMDFTSEDFQKLNVLAFHERRLIDYHAEIFAALLYKDEPETLDELIVIAHDAKTAVLWDALNKNDLGRELIEAEYMEVSEELFPLINYKKLAQHYLEGTDSALTPYGFVTRLYDDDDQPPCCLECEAKEIIEETLQQIEQEKLAVIILAG